MNCSVVVDQQISGPRNNFFQGASSASLHWKQFNFTPPRVVVVLEKLLLWGGNEDDVWRGGVALVGW
jgi:hypothetical protein